MALIAGGPAAMSLIDTAIAVIATPQSASLMTAIGAGVRAYNNVDAVMRSGAETATQLISPTRVRQGFELADSIRKKMREGLSPMKSREQDMGSPMRPSLTSQLLKQKALDRAKALLNKSPAGKKRTRPGVTVSFSPGPTTWRSTNVGRRKNARRRRRR